MSWKDWSCSSFLPKASTWKSVEEHFRCEFTLFNVVIIVTCHIDFLGTFFKLNVRHVRTFWSWCVDPTAHVPVAIIYHEQPPGTRQFPYTSLLTVYFSRRISIDIYIYIQTHEFYAISNVIIIWIYPPFLVFLCSQYLHHIALHRADLRHCGCFKVCNLPTGPLPTGRVFWTSKMPACGSWWSTLVNTLIYSSKHVGNRGLAVESVVKGFWCFSAVANKQLPCMTLYNLEWFI